MSEQLIEVVDNAGIVRLTINRLFNSIKTSCKTMFCLQNKKEEMGITIQKRV